MKHSIGGMTYENILWTYFRNGLTHGFAICQGGFEHQPNYFSVKTSSGKPTLILDPRNFLNDFIDGIKEYLADLRAATVGDSIAQNFEKVFKNVFIDGK